MGNSRAQTIIDNWTITTTNTEVHAISNQPPIDDYGYSEIHYYQNQPLEMVVWAPSPKRDEETPEVIIPFTVMRAFLTAIDEVTNALRVDQKDPIP